MALRPVVYIVDDDESFRASMARLLRAAGHQAATYASADEFLAANVSGPGCIVLDVSMPGISGVELQQRLRERGAVPPIVFLTGHGDIPTSVRAMRDGAEDFLTKPASAPELLDAIGRALVRDATERSQRARLDALRTRCETLTPKEREVFAWVVSGRLNKQIAYEFGRAERTIKAHRARVMEKMQADSVAELVRMADELGITPPPPDRPGGN